MSGVAPSVIQIAKFAPRVPHNEANFAIRTLGWVERSEDPAPASDETGASLTLDRTNDREVPMDEDKFNMSLRKFLKQVGVTSQREIERIVREQGPGQRKLKVKMVLTAAGTSLNHVVEEEIDLG